jgi:hypothetical protein
MSDELDGTGPGDYAPGPFFWPGNYVDFADASETPRRYSAAAESAIAAKTLASS